MLKPVKDRVIIEMEAAETKTKGGIILPDVNKEKPQKGRVIATGKDVTQVKEGDYVIFARYEGYEIKHDEKVYLIQKETDILTIIKE